MRHLARRPATHVRSWVPQLLLLGAGLTALGLAVVVLLSVTGSPAGLGLLGLGDPEPRLAAGASAPPGAAEPGRAGGPGEASAAGPAPVRAPPRGGSAAPGAERWAARLLQAWDRARERAWQAADPVALRALYVPGSTAAERDAELLERWREAGVEVRTLRLRVDDLEVVVLERHRALLEVTDRLRVHAVAGGSATVLRLGRDRPSTRVVELRRDDDLWQVARVVPAGTT